ncbi:MAG: T9SS type A sorting domain-containing protein [Bacteroidales bacterium]|nr:T9SS type A sorting domain-containing protein [Bacteroidales bacterium]
MKKIFFTIISLLIFSFLSAQIIPTDGIVYVADDGIGNGSSWSSATPDLQGAINADGVEQVWVKQGTYKPTYQYDIEDPRAFSFVLKNGVIVYGGFNNSTPNPTLSERNPFYYETVLNGDINNQYDDTDDAYHIIYHDMYSGIDSTAIIDGFFIIGGNANGTYYENSRGAGAYNDNCNPVFINCVFNANYAEKGAAVYNYNASPYFYNCDFIENEATEDGGGMFNDSSSPYLQYCLFDKNYVQGNGAGVLNFGSSNPYITGCEFIQNVAVADGGGILNTENSNPQIISSIIWCNEAVNGAGILNNASSSPLIVNTIITANSASSAGGAIVNNENCNAEIINCTIHNNSAPVGGGIANSNSNPEIYNTVVYTNGTQIVNVGTSVPVVQYCCVEDGYSGEGNIDADPAFSNSGLTHYLFPSPASPLIDAGNNSFIPENILSDFNNRNRIVGETVDIGVFEHLKVIFVDASNTHQQVGEEWYNAYTSLNVAIENCPEGMDIWVADGTYKPDDNYGVGTGDRYFHFPLKKGVRILGGFAGTEYYEYQRDFETNKCYLDGNLGAEKVYHVFYSSSTDVDTTCIVDGFYIRNGNADGTNDFTRNGGNIYLLSASPLFKNCQIYSGYAYLNGGNVYLGGSSAVFEDCNISSGQAEYEGGGLYTSNSNALFSYCKFEENYVYGNGGGISIKNNGFNIFNSCYFSFNDASDIGNGGGAYVQDVDSVLFLNCWFFENYANQNGANLDINSRAIIVNNDIQWGYLSGTSNQGGNIFAKANADISIVNSIINNGNADADANIGIQTGGNVDISYSGIAGCGGSGDNWDTNLGNDLGGNLDFNEDWNTYEQAIENNWQGIDAGTNSPFENGGIAENFKSDYLKMNRIRGDKIDLGCREIPYAFIKFYLTPDEIAGSTQCTYDGGVTWFYNNDSIWETPKTITITFDDVENYITPDDITLTLEWNEDYIVYGNYIIIENISENSEKNLSVYPNPTIGTINIDIEQVEQNETIFIFNITGQLIQSIPAKNQNQIDLSDYDNGIYLIKANTETVKIIKH